MPYEKTVKELKHWWCPKWYWPFAVCSGMRTQHKWCYNFSWVAKTVIAGVAGKSGCENGKLYTWYEFEPALFEETEHEVQFGEMCFDSSRGADEGPCDGNVTGMLAGRLTSDTAYASAINVEYADLAESVVESGEFDFSGEHQTRCQKGLWSWKRVIHETEVTATVTKRFTEIKWQVAGVDITATAGTISVGAQCWWPFPLPKGRKEYRIVQLAYVLVVEGEKSILRLKNDPKDGCFEVSLSMIAMLGVHQIASSVGYASFVGETCDFDADKVAAQILCFGQRLKELLEVRQLPEKPGPTDPIVVFSEEAWRRAAHDRSGTIRPLLDIMSISPPNDPSELSSGLAQLQREIGTADIMSLVSIRPAAEVLGGFAPGCQACRAVRFGAALAGVLAIGIIAGGLLI